MNPYREALKYLWDGKSEKGDLCTFICYALSAASIARSKGVDGPTILALGKVQRLLAPHTTATDWLRANSKEANQCLVSGPHLPEVQEWRRCWLTQLADEYDKQMAKL